MYWHETAGKSETGESFNSVVMIGGRSLEEAEERGGVSARDFRPPMPPARV